MRAAATINIADYATDIEHGNTGAGTIVPQSPPQLQELTIKMETQGSKNIPKKIDDAFAGAAKAIERADDAVHKTTPTPPGDGDTDADGTITKTESSGLYSLGNVEIRASIRVIPLDVWVATMEERTSFNVKGLVVEQPVTPLPPHLHSYAHGGFMGLACSVLYDPVWSKILEEESPDGWAALQRSRLALKFKGDAPGVAQGKYMATLENSPVLCAYGLVRTGSCRPFVPGADVELENYHRHLQQQQQEEEKMLAPPTQEMEYAEEIQSGKQQQQEVEDKKTVTRPVAALRRYLKAMAMPNAYGYRPLAMEWDIWVNPHRPESLQDATINHGSAAALVQQAILTTIPLMDTCAKRAGKSQILGQGVSPVKWLTQLGYAINRGVHGDKNIPLLQGGGGSARTEQDDSRWRLHVTLHEVQGLGEDGWVRVFVEGDIDSDDVVLPPQRSVGDGSGKFTGEDNNAKMTFWPLPKELQYDDLLLVVRGNPRGIRQRQGIGVARLSLAEVVGRYPDLLDGSAVEMDVSVGEWSKNPRKRMNVVRYRDEEGDVEDAVEGGGDDVEMAVGLPDARPMTEIRKLSIKVSLRFESVGVITAMTELGVPRAAAQTAVAMLSNPGGLYLDVKSAYSTAYDLQVFVSMLMGIGITTKAVCSFKPEQLEVGAIADTVLFFHGLSGVENACDAGKVRNGQFVLFNGASFLADLTPTVFESMSKSVVQEVATTTQAWPVDDLALRKYQYLCDTYGIIGGIYVQEPDTAPSGIDALCALVAAHPRSFPLGFAYGHLSGKSVGFFDARGRGFASQQIVEEFAARKDLSGKAIRRIKAGEHQRASFTVHVVWANRLLHGENWMSVKEQRAFCQLLAEVHPEETISALVSEVGGIERIVGRFHQHYELTTPLTLLEAGMNWNYTKSALRILRNRGVIARLSLPQKIDLAKFFVGPTMRGYGATYVAQATGLRRGLHKHAKEGLMCVLESCTKPEFDSVVHALGDRVAVVRYLRGWLHVSWRYTGRLKAVEQVHASEDGKGDSDDVEYAVHRRVPLPYEDQALKYAARMFPSSKATHTRDKPFVESAWRWSRKSVCCAFTTFYTLIFNMITIGFFCWCCVMPRCCGGALRGALGMPVILAVILGFLLATATLVAVSGLKPWIGD